MDDIVIGQCDFHPYSSFDRIVKKVQTMDEGKCADWRSEKYGKTDFDRLRYFLCGAYMCCKDIDSTNWFEHWPDDIRLYVAQAYSMIQAWNRSNKLNKINPEPEEIAANEKEMDVSAVNKLGWRFLLEALKKEEENGI